MHNKTLSEQDVDDFNLALSLVYVASMLEDPTSIDEAVHLRSVCSVAADKLCAIRNRLNPDGIEVGK